MTGLWLICKSFVLQSQASPQAAILLVETQQCPRQSETKERRDGVGGNPALACKCFAVEVTEISCTQSPLIKASHVTQTPCKGSGECEGARAY